MTGDSHPWLKCHIFQSDSSLFKFWNVLSHILFSYAASLCLLTLTALPWLTSPSQYPPSICGHKPMFVIWGRLEDLLPHPWKRNPHSSDSQSQLYHSWLLSIRHSWSKKALEGAWELELLARQRSGSRSPPPPRIHVLQGGFSSYLSLKTFLRGTVCPQVGIMLH